MEELNIENNTELENSENQTTTQDQSLTSDNKQEDKQQKTTEALDKEIQRRKKELFELGDMLRKLKEENQSVVEKIKSENIEIAIKELSQKYQLSDEQKNQIVEKIKSSDAISKEKILDVATATYYSLNPDKIKELEELSKRINSSVEELNKKQISSSSSQPNPEGSEFTPEELAIMQKYNVKPETIKKMKEGKIGYSLNQYSKTIEF